MGPILSWPIKIIQHSTIMKTEEITCPLSWYTVYATSFAQWTCTMLCWTLFLDGRMHPDAMKCLHCCITSTSHHEFLRHDTLQGPTLKGQLEKMYCIRFGLRLWIRGRSKMTSPGQGNGDIHHCFRLQILLFSRWQGRDGGVEMVIFSVTSFLNGPLGW